jgi:predicted dienelactone hydrolase
MRALEVVLVAILLLGLPRSLRPAGKRVLRTPWFETLMLATLLGHWVLEGYRWQMIPAYILTGILLLGSLRGGARVGGRGLRGLLIVLGVLGLAVSAALPALLPVPRLSPPAGPFHVGTVTWHWIDQARRDPYAPDVESPRELMVQVWYPTDDAGSGQYAPWMDAAEQVAPAIARWLGLPSFTLDHLRLAGTNAIPAAPLAAGAEFPVLIFSHGWGGFRAQNTNQMQHLASHGYVILAVEHTYGAVLTVFPAGRVAEHNPATIPAGLPEGESLRATRQLGAQWAGDIRFALDQLEALLDAGDAGPLNGSIDTAQVGVFGHSTGGGAAVEFCATDARCAALLTMDPFLKPVSGTALEAGVAPPALHMFSETWSSDENWMRFDQLTSNDASPSIAVTIQGTAHYDFSDLPLLTPLAHALGLKGPLAGPRVLEILNVYSLAFFDATLKDRTSALLGEPDAGYPEVLFRP